MSISMKRCRVAVSALFAVLALTLAFGSSHAFAWSSSTEFGPDGGPGGGAHLWSSQLNGTDTTLTRGVLVAFQASSSNDGTNWYTPDMQYGIINFGALGTETSPKIALGVYNDQVVNGVHYPWNLVTSGTGTRGTTTACGGSGWLSSQACFSNTVPAQLTADPRQWFVYLQPYATTTGTEKIRTISTTSGCPAGLKSFGAGYTTFSSLPSTFASTMATHWTSEPHAEASVAEEYGTYLVNGYYSSTFC